MNRFLPNSYHKCTNLTPFIGREHDSVGSFRLPVPLFFFAQNDFCRPNGWSDRTKIWVTSSFHSRLHFEAPPVAFRSKAVSTILPGYSLCHRGHVLNGFWNITKLIILVQMILVIWRGKPLSEAMFFLFILLPSVRAILTLREIWTWVEIEWIKVLILSIIQEDILRLLKQA